MTAARITLKPTGPQDGFGAMDKTAVVSLLDIRAGVASAGISGRLDRGMVEDIRRALPKLPPARCAKRL